MTPQDMISVMLDPDFQGDGELSNDLLSEFKRGFPIESLRPLLTSSNVHTQGSAAFIATFFWHELQPMLREIAALLESSETRIRFDAIEAIQQCTTGKDGEVLGRVLLCLDDDWHGVRWKTVGFISLAASWQLELAVKHAAILCPKSAFAVIRNQFRLDMDRKTIRSLIQNDDPILRRFGAGMAVRPRCVLLLEHVDFLSQSADPDLVRIAESARRGVLTGINTSFASRVDFVPQPKAAKRR
ncbi:hypothetical protein ASD44_10925 [Mesorhizobium sp. Root554]|uniref:hypothetical protein n=1 Tax=unclassified Mesorhizobium TaxID=325217 RepID=UPI0006FD8C68|nr:MULTISPECIES: hypothetical protein [unclassified Mesorhizobium]KQZ14527.1 hypothetical protein ASD27_10935 [Mesorhizobium sp. Root1471]KQZ37035.1 hypothetical protein ASD44_10925 [Mesorhizobium sp. Root554]